MKRDDIIDQYHNSGTASLPLQPSRSMPNATALLRDAAREIGATVQIYAAERVPLAGATHVVGRIIHGPSEGGCWLCRQTVERLARRLYQWVFTEPAVNCCGILTRIINDDPDNWQQTTVGGFTSAAKATRWINRKNVA